MFWNWRNPGPQVLLSLLEKQKYDGNFHLVYKISPSLFPKVYQFTVHPQQARSADVVELTPLNPPTNLL